MLKLKNNLNCGAGRRPDNLFQTISVLLYCRLLNIISVTV